MLVQFISFVNSLAPVSPISNVITASQFIFRKAKDQLKKKISNRLWQLTVKNGEIYSWQISNTERSDPWTAQRSFFNVSDLLLNMNSIVYNDWLAPNATSGCSSYQTTKDGLFSKTWGAAESCLKSWDWWSKIPAYPKSHTSNNNWNPTGFKWSHFLDSHFEQVLDTYLTFKKNTNG